MAYRVGVTGSLLGRHGPVWHGAFCAGLCCIVLLVGGCTGKSVVAPVGRASEGTVSSGSGEHLVRPGDTLYSIAWRYGLDYRELARWNGIAEPFVIYSGQRLRISRPSVLPSASAKASAAPPSVARARTPPKSTPRPAAPAARAQPEAAAAASTARATPRRSAPPRRDERAVRSWRWPAKGKVVGAFSGAGGKGIDIAGVAGSPVVAAASGRVVYSGSGLRGYGKLIIVKHNKRYLSAYAHNDRLHVAEGDSVTSGQKIADMGSSDAKQVMLHFEIRRDGKPVDPIRYLPR